ncbi:MAG: serine/threonine protein kinase [Muribaculaceae bacterium]|nr:serine/threonine protein kinase [Muribaculaceae bacterium]
MEYNSGIFADFESFLFNKSKDGSILLKITSHSKIYRLDHDGKFFLFKTSSDQTERGKAIIRREYELSLGCDHPHIAHIFLYEKASPLGEGILMEYIEGRNLNDYLAENPSPKSRERILWELLEAIHYLHKKGIVHNDLKPENILISRNGDSLKLIDFGLSDDDAHFMIKTPGCSPAFAAPELKEDRKSDVRSDIYSVGKIMRMLIGKRYEGISSKCCHENPEKRFQNIDFLIKAWKKRDRVRTYIFIMIPILLFLSFFFIFIFRIKSRNSAMEDSLMKQNIVIENQKEEIKDLQLAYMAVKDSLESVTSRQDNFERLKKERIESFTQGFDKRFKIAYDSISRCNNPNEISNIGFNFINEAKSYYNKFDKYVEGKDISSDLYPVFLEKMQNSSDDFQKEIQKMMK